MDIDLSSLLRPPRDPLPIPDPWAWVHPSLWATIAVLTLILVFLWWRRQPRRLPPPPHPAVLARRRIAAVPADAPPEAVAATAVAALRQYCAARFGLPTSGRTSEELLAGLRDRPGLQPTLAESLGSFLEVRDLIAFAGPLAAATEATTVRERAEAFLNEAETPAPAPAPVPAPPPAEPAAAPSAPAAPPAQS